MITGPAISHGGRVHWTTLYYVPAVHPAQRGA
jgi:hypothetical protein